MTGVVTNNAEYDVIAWVGAGAGSADIDALFVDDSGVLKHFPINSADWEVVRV